jgi:hypothetical protein
MAESKQMPKGERDQALSEIEIEPDAWDRFKSMVHRMAHKPKPKSDARDKATPRRRKASE